MRAGGLVLAGPRLAQRGAAVTVEAQWSVVWAGTTAQEPSKTVCAWIATLHLQFPLSGVRNFTSEEETDKSTVAHSMSAILKVSHWSPRLTACSYLLAFCTATN